ncbi:ORC1/DEAH AAA+ ATPase domain-containing protein [Plasmodiophora brassicae]|uniref:ORC1/DEAH AAA+ ATPase domain-containing protein n=1 Tax=Plasmodiophora brassicae TaxID=37360 RepID=A0A0G4IT11_PLABS|nr:hypothetical protein PBRA_006476 [Plasmodiophora brassicae]SPQ94447.1 unnamed protein product [Plasmodiophora brassicae]
MTRLTRSSSGVRQRTVFDSLPQRKPRTKAAVAKAKTEVEIVKAPVDRYLEAMRALKTSPPSSASIPCRQAEEGTVQSFIDGCRQRGHGGSLYVVGSPGTGKSITIDAVVSRQRSCRKATLNAMSLPSPNALYSRLFTELTDRTASSSDAIDHLDRLFTTGSAMQIVVIDEIDGLLSSTADALYRLFQWAHAPESTLILIGIANTSQVTDRYLPRLAQHDIHPQRLTFKAYSPAELTCILRERVPLPIFDTHAADLLARKVAGSAAGDARKFLDLCRKAISAASSTRDDCIRVATVSRVLNGAFESRHVTIIRGLPTHQKITLCMLALMTTPTTTVGQFREFYAREAQRQSVPVASGADLQPIIQSLVSAGMVDLKQRPRQTFQDAVLTCRAQKADIQFALKDEHYFATLLKSQLAS